MPYVFGPVPSRRLGFSLGIDLVALKTCSFDCLYCQVGRTTCKILEPGPLVPIEEVRKELKTNLEGIRSDIITFSGSGEPTLNSEIHLIIDFVKRLTETKIAVLTNGSLLWREEVRRRILKADIIMPTLSSVFEDTFNAIHNPHSDLRLCNIIDGLRLLRKEYDGNLYLEVVLLKGLNDSAQEIEGLGEVIDQINPDKVQLNTVVRPPADSRALSLDRKRLEEIKSFFGEKAEIIADIPPGRKHQAHGSMRDRVVEMVKRRPVSEVDVTSVLNIPEDEARRILKGLTVKGVLRRESHRGKVFYVSTYHGP